MKAIILAAGQGKRSGIEYPKCLIRIGGLPLLKRYFMALSGIEKIVVTGYKKELIINSFSYWDYKSLFNPHYRKGSALSLWYARDFLNDDVIIMDSDVYFEPAVMEKMLASKKKDFFLIDTSSVVDCEAMSIGFKNGRAEALWRGENRKYKIKGEWTGFLRLSKKNAVRLRNILEVNVKNDFLSYEYLLCGLFEYGIGYEDILGLKWTEIDFPEDIQKAEKLYDE